MHFSTIFLTAKVHFPLQSGLLVLEWPFQLHEADFPVCDWIPPPNTESLQLANKKQECFWKAASGVVWRVRVKSGGDTFPTGLHFMELSDSPFCSCFCYHYSLAGCFLQVAGTEQPSLLKQKSKQKLQSWKALFQSLKQLHKLAQAWDGILISPQIMFLNFSMSNVVYATTVALALISLSQICCIYLVPLLQLFLLSWGYTDSWAWGWLLFTAVNEE